MLRNGKIAVWVLRTVANSLYRFFLNLYSTPTEKAEVPVVVRVGRRLAGVEAIAVAGKQRIGRDAEDPVLGAVQVDVAAEDRGRGNLVVVEAALAGVCGQSCERK